MGYQITELTGSQIAAIVAALQALEPGLVTTSQAGKLAPDAAIENGKYKDATTSLHGLMPMTDKQFLEAIKADPFALIGLGVANTRTAGFHNSIYRGKNLGSSVSAAQWAAISAGTFDDLFIGDYWTINGVNWRIAAFDYWINNGDTACYTHHVVIIPDSNILAADGSTTHWLHHENVTSGGYVGTDFYAGTNSNDGKTRCRNAANSAFGSGHILTHREYLTNACTNGKPSAGSWYDSDIEIPNERMVYGNAPFSPVSDGSTVPSNYTIDNAQLPLFAHDHSRICNRASWWLRDPVSGPHFAYVSISGLCNYHSASDAGVGVRPVFGIRA
ncbi:MAG: hypothetical protein IJK98_11940 [Clostridia bacterium]|nr:hypothetical protein [Clostridia bacterium]